MDPLGSSECSSGCESGWTLYLDHSVSSSPNPSNYRETHGFTEKSAKGKRVNEDDDDEEEEEDLSMVSDASSGPPHFNEDEACDYGQFNHYSVSSSRETAFNSGKKQRKRENRGRKEDRKTASFVDDTASSPFFNLSNSNYSVNSNYNINQASLGSALDYSQGFSATHFQSRPAFQEEFGLFQSPLSGNPVQNNQWF